MSHIMWCDTASLHLNDLGFFFHFLSVLMGLLSVLSAESNEFLLSFYSHCPFHLNLSSRTYLLKFTVQGVVW